MLETQPLFPSVPLWKFLSLASGQRPSWQDRVQQLLDGKAYFPSPIDFNDPFDSLPYLQVPAKKENLVDVAPFLVARMVKALKEIPEEVVREQIQTALTQVNPVELSQTMNECIAQTAGEMGLFCLSETIDSVLMWSHYSSNHTGIALRFRIDRDPRNTIGPMMKVRYQDDRPNLDLFCSTDLQYDIADALCMKASFWKYEQEWRSIRTNAMRTIVEFNPEVIDAIAFGARCSDQDKDDIRSMSGSRSISFLQVIADRASYGLKLIDE